MLPLEQLKTKKNLPFKLKLPKHKWKKIESGWEMSVMQQMINLITVLHFHTNF